jgi:hypothetical protein
VRHSLPSVNWLVVPAQCLFNPLNRKLYEPNYRALGSYASSGIALV